jgi:hypothetical protein
MRSEDARAKRVNEVSGCSSRLPLSLLEGMARASCLQFVQSVPHAGRLAEGRPLSEDGLTKTTSPRGLTSVYREQAR